MTDPVITLENISRLLPTLDPQERRSESGRLILTRDALHFVQGWETVQQVNHNGGLFGALLTLAARSPELVDTRAEGARILAEVRGLPPEEQVRSVSGSFTVPAADIDSARLGLLLSLLTVVTEARGDSYTFVLERRHRGAVKAWLAGLPRKP